MTMHFCLRMVLTSSLVLGLHTAWAQDVPTSLAWDVAAAPRHAALGGLDVAPLEADGWSVAVHPCALDSSVERDVYTSYLDYFAGIRSGAVTWPLAHRGRRASHVGIRFASFGTFEGTTAAGLEAGNFSGGDYIAQYGTAWALGPQWTVGATGWTGLRNLAQVNAGVLGVDLGALRRTRNGMGALGFVVSNLGLQEDFSGIMPQGRLPHNVQVGWTQTFPNAPFTFHLRMQRLNTWELAPDGTYDDAYDPLTGEVIPNDIWEWGDQFARHLTGGVTLKLGPQLTGHLGYNHQRQKTMVAAGRTGLNGLSLGLQGQFKALRYSVARSVYHFAGTSTHLALAIQVPQQGGESGANRP